MQYAQPYKSRVQSPYKIRRDVTAAWFVLYENTEATSTLRETDQQNTSLGYK